MGSVIEINDTLKISKARGFPAELNLAEHVCNAVASLERIKDKQYSFWNAGERVYHRAPTRVFLVEEIEGKWLYWGHALVLQQTMSSDKTEGIFKVAKLYDPDYQRQVTINESPAGKSYF